MPRIIRINERDNVGIPLADIAKGTAVAEGISAAEDIPQGHKIALTPLEKGDAVIRYGAFLGALKTAVPAGGWIREHMLELPPAAALDSLPWGTGIAAPRAVRREDLPGGGFFDGYQTPGSRFAGIRNILGIMTTVQCVAGVLNVATRKIREEILPRYPNVDDVVPLNHAYGCGVAIKGSGADVPIRTLKNMIRHPNFGGEIMVVALGCEKLTLDMLLEPDENNAENVIVLQQLRGFNAMIDAITGMAEQKLKRLNRRRRVSLPLEKLCVGLQCGGSDAFSGITANPAAGYASDLLAAAGATVLFSEVSEVRDGVEQLSARCPDGETAKKFASEIAWYDRYLAAGGIDRSANPSPGNKAGGLSNIVEKALGSIAKSGTSPVVEVLSPGEQPSKPGVIFAATPASDFLCGPLQMASGIALQVFMTGRGTPYGLAAVPVIKVSSRSDLRDFWQDLIDLNAGTIAEGSETVEEAGTRLFAMIIETAGGRYKPWAEQYALHNDICLFNPAPVT
jgi:galactarate dehydratase